MWLIELIAKNIAPATLPKIKSSILAKSVSSGLRGKVSF